MLKQIKTKRELNSSSVYYIRQYDKKGSELPTNQWRKAACQRRRLYTDGREVIFNEPMKDVFEHVEVKKAK